MSFTPSGDGVESRSHSYRLTDWWGLLVLAALFCVPFLMNVRTGPLAGFHIENTAFILALLAALLAACGGGFRVALPRASYYFMMLALFWWVQARWMALPFQGNSDMVAAVFIGVALLAWAVRFWVLCFGQERVLAVIAWGLVVGALLQSAVMVMQFADWEHYFHGVVSHTSSQNIFGQLGQRNHLGHYMLWGVLAAAYLWSSRQIRPMLGLVLTVWLGISMGLVGSRSVIVYAVVVSALAVVWRLRGGAAINRAVLIVLFAMVWVAMMQLGVVKWLALLDTATVHSGLERVLASGGEVDPARNFEWRKALRVFQTSPWWGHGWNSYSLQGFLMDAQPEFLQRPHSNVLFTHSHNIILQLLAEMGAVGTALVVGGFAWVLRPYFRQPERTEPLFLLGMLAVSLCHSLLEYPLWYVYFLVPFAVLMSVTEPGRPAVHSVQLGSRRWPVLAWAGFVLVVILLVESIRLGFVYQDIIRLSHRTGQETAVQTEAKNQGLLKLAQQEPLLAYYALLELMQKGNPAATAPLKDWELDTARQVAEYRPYGGLDFTWGLYQQRAGLKDRNGEATALPWLEHTWHYYPNMLPSYDAQIRASEYFKPLQAPASAACLRYQPYNPGLACTLVKPDAK